MTTRAAEVITDWIKKKIMGDRGYLEMCSFKQCRPHHAGLIKDLVHG